MENKRKVLSFGYKEAMVDACRRLGFDIVSLIDPWDKPESLPPCKEGESRIFTQDNTKDELILSALSRKDELSFEAAFSPFETTLVNASLLAHIVAKPFIDPLVAVAFRDKYYQKKLLRGNVPVANSWIIEDLKNTNLDEDYPYPIVLKPVAGAGTAHTYKVSNKQELKKIIQKHLNDKILPQCMVIEEFISGQEWHIDGWISDGELQLFTISKYSVPLIGIQNGGLVQSVTLRPELHKDLYDRVKPFLISVFNTLNLQNGVFHLEMFYDDKADKFIFSECGARIGGGLIAHKFQHMFKVDINEILVRLALGEKVEWSNKEATTEYTGWTYLPSIDPNTKCLPEVSALKETPGVVEVHYNWKPGNEMPDTRVSTTQRTGMALVVGDSEEQVRDRMNKLVNHFVNLTQNTILA